MWISRTVIPVTTAGEEGAWLIQLVGGASGSMCSNAVDRVRPGETRDKGCMKYYIVSVFLEFCGL